MEITPFTMYIFTRLDIFLAVSIIGLIVSAFISAMIFADIKCAQEFNRPKDEALAKKEFKVSIAFVLLFLLCATFIPSKKAAAFIYVVPKVVNNEKIQTIASERPLHDAAFSRAVEIQFSSYIGDSISVRNQSIRHRLILMNLALRTFNPMLRKQTPSV